MQIELGHRSYHLWTILADIKGASSSRRALLLGNCSVTDQLRGRSPDRKHLMAKLLCIVCVKGKFEHRPAQGDGVLDGVFLGSDKERIARIARIRLLFTVLICINSLPVTIGDRADPFEKRPECRLRWYHYHILRLRIDPPGSGQKGGGRNQRETSQDAQLQICGRMRCT